jgi:hypothetical protein
MMVDVVLFGNKVVKMEKYIRSACILSLAAAMSIAALPAAFAQKSPPAGSYNLAISETGELSLVSRGAALKTIMAQIGEKLSLTYEISDKHLDHPISISFHSMSLQSAIKRILHGISHACILNAEGRVERIVTLPETTAKAGHPFASAPLSDRKARQTDSSPPKEMHMEMPKVRSALPMPSPDMMQALIEDLAPVSPPLDSVYVHNERRP